MLMLLLMHYIQVNCIHKFSHKLAKIFAEFTIKRRLEMCVENIANKIIHTRTHTKTLTY